MNFFLKGREGEEKEEEIIFQEHKAVRHGLTQAQVAAFSVLKKKLNLLKKTGDKNPLLLRDAVEESFRSFNCNDNYLIREKFLEVCDSLRMHGLKKELLEFIKKHNI